MNHNTEVPAMICPCCGTTSIIDGSTCQNCEARAIDAPLVQPENKLPSLGPAILALGLATAILLAFLATWFLGNDMKVARVLIVAILGENLAFTRSLLALDPSLPEYRIFTYDAYRLASYMSVGLVPLSLFGLWLARRAMKLQKFQPSLWGGQRMAVSALLLSLFWVVLFGAAGISSIPRALQRGRAKHLAAVRAQFYRMHNEALTRYYAEFGTYPQELSDLRDFVPDPIPVNDYWGTAISYSPTALIASKKSAPGFSTYQLVSAGPDAVMGTVDDIRMIDGVIVNASEDGDWFTSFFRQKSATNDR